LARRCQPVGDSGKKLDVVLLRHAVIFRRPILTRCWRKSSTGTVWPSVGDLGRLQYPAVSRAFHGIVDDILSVDLAATEGAKPMVLGSQRLSARDALHLAVMEGIQCIKSLALTLNLTATRGLHVCGKGLLDPPCRGARRRRENAFAVARPKRFELSRPGFVVRALLPSTCFVARFLPRHRNSTGFQPSATVSDKNLQVFVN